MTSGMPDLEIQRIWPDARPLHFLKENRTRFYMGAELVAVVKYRTIEHLAHPEEAAGRLDAKADRLRADLRGGAAVGRGRGRAGPGPGSGEEGG